MDIFLFFESSTLFAIGGTDEMRGSPPRSPHFV